MRQRLWAALAAVVVLACASNPASAGVIVSVPGPANSSNIVMQLSNTGPTDITSATFDLTGTALGLVIDTSGQIFNTVPPAGGTITYGGNNAARTIFSVNFTGFNAGESSSFAWDPDTAGDPSFGAIVSDLIGTQVTVNFSDGSSQTGTLVPDPGTGGLVAAAIPEPATMAVFGLMAAGAFGLRRRMKQSA
jgi:hypothetical protein